MQKIILYLKLMRFDKPIGILLLLWPTLWALWIAAGGLPPLKILMVFILGTVLMRAAGCVINDYADRHWDKYVERTKDRPLTSGALNPIEALVLFGVLILLAFALVLLLNPLTIKLAIVGALLSAIYPFSKRLIAFPQFILGLAFAWAIPMAFAAVLNSIPPISVLIFAITVLWAMIYDTEYAMVDRADDLKIGIKSTAILFGRADRWWIGIMQILFLILLTHLGWYTHSHASYYLACALVALLFLYQQILIRERKPKLCFKAFLSNHWIGLILFLARLLET